MHEGSDRCAIAQETEKLIQRLRRKGVALWMEDAGLRYRAPKGALTVEERRALSGANEEIAILLRRHSGMLGSDKFVSRSAGVRRAQLSYTQLAHWQDRLRYGSRPIRQVACEFHLQGPLRADLLKESIAAVGRRHDALRTRIVLGENMEPMQEVADRYLSELEIILVPSARESQRQIEVEHQVQRVIVDAVDYATTPLFKAALLVIDASDHVLILAMDHIISDFASLKLLSEEIFTAYGQLAQGAAIDLPGVAVQFPDHAARLRAQPSEVLSRAVRRLESIGRTRFPSDSRRGVWSDGKGFGRAHFSIDRRAMDELRLWARRRGTTGVMATFAAYAALIMRWCGVRETVIQFMTDGRPSAELEQTVGYLAFPIYVRVTHEVDSTFTDILRMVTEEYCTARDEADFGFATAQGSQPGFTCNTGVNWLAAVDAGSGTIVGGAEVTLGRSSVDLSTAQMQGFAEYDEEPVVLFSERDGGISGCVSYVRNRFSEAEMARFAGNIKEFVTAMITQPMRRILDAELK